MNMRCPAPWHEMFITAAENKISSCCYYRGPVIPLAPLMDSQPEIAEVWNDPRLQAVRALQSTDGHADGDNGCAGCHFFENRPDRQSAPYVDFDALLASGLSPEQHANTQAARDDYRCGRVQPTALPLRYFLLFGQTCNIDCVMCIQIPTRKHEIELSWPLLQKWWTAFSSAISVDVIGGEPLAIPSAIKFIRAFVADPALEAVRLTLFTNGTIVHKHLEALKAKRRLGFAISLDSIGAGYERIRAGGTWAEVERNLLAIRALMDTSHPDWTLSTNALVMKSGLPYLAEFARFHVAHRIPCTFHSINLSRGMEEPQYAEDIVSYPWLLDDSPDWRDHFDQAIAIYREAGFTTEVGQLELFRDRIGHQRQDRAAIGATGPALVEVIGGDAVRGHIGRTGRLPPAPLRQRGETLAYRPDSLAEVYVLQFPRPALGAGMVRIRLGWSPLAEGADTLPAIAVFDPQPGLRLLSRDLRRDAGGHTVDMVVAIDDIGHDRPLEVALKPMLAGTEAVLPDRLALYRITAEADC